MMTLLVSVSCLFANINHYSGLKMKIDNFSYLNSHSSCNLNGGRLFYLENFHVQHFDDRVPAL